MKKESRISVLAGAVCLSLLTSGTLSATTATRFGSPCLAPLSSF
ncbi:hypothetical protein RA955_10355 [Geobacillus proteiniphilus]|uniref:Uncharacterized protein n=1 Tax=Geobacillus proteiniphilus TaxID=860353 RepID=A0ABY9MK66_9BACL|nr:MULTISPECIES: hypothetical protein [Geobacillus]WMJ18432.1 hypothetical protein RA955_10355 [Geobacillus proteiniphilus]